ncbi:nuclease-related domain-containing protein [Lederbergia panacisoli]|uniref:nuclease-related domain-containing protein n=1 Tax=Lederbergia panacisoli TaxID=1255251 RepID=UPI00214CDEBF|nr:nuclease-related domain-containing protein [Lederbergia panacisoli]MCR2821448.1 NERD domain-containing protein [Lederbergia panacisoli]
MFRLKRTKPIKLVKLEAASGRIPRRHQCQPLLQQEMNTRTSGYEGEKSVDYHLSFLHGKECSILNGLRLPNHIGFYFQTDTLSLFPNFLTPIEIKAHKGKLTFDKVFGQMIHESLDGKRQAYEDPTVQVQRHCLQIRHWLHQHGFPIPPLDPLVVISDPNTIIEVKGNPDDYRHIIRAGSIYEKISEFEEKHQKRYISKPDLSRLANMLINQNTPETFDVLKFLNVRPDEVLPGVHCPKCRHLGIKRLIGKWKCSLCSLTSKTAHIEALRDYALLIGTTITNQRCRWFLHLDSRYTARDLLTALNLPYTGTTKGRVYDLSVLIHKK